MSLPDSSKLSPAFSVYLDAFRFAAALGVVFVHLAQYGWISGSTGVGRSSMVLFVLSGFVITYTAHVKDRNLKDYAIARLTRLYSVVIPTLILSFALTLWLSSMAGTELPYQTKKFYIYFPLHMLFAGELWKLSEVPPALAPFWSLGYEAWYYVLFGCALFLKGPKRWVCVAFVLACMGPKLWLLLPVWLSGTVLYKVHGRFECRIAYAVAGWIGSILLLCLFKYVDGVDVLREVGRQLWPWKGFLLGSAERYLADYVVTLIVLINLFFASKLPWSFLLQHRKVIHKLASLTFALYLTHMLVMTAYGALFGIGTGLQLAGLIVSICAATYAMYHLGEWIRTGMLKVAKEGVPSIGLVPAKI